jgi:DNA-binding beta-propeller fold protein YncE
VFVTDGNSQRIQKFSSVGTYLTQWGSLGAGDGQFESPRGIAVDDSGNVYVADSDMYAGGRHDQIQKFTSSGTFITRWGTYGHGNGQFSDPDDVAVDASGNVYVADTENGRVQKFTSSGTYMTEWGYPGAGGSFIQFLAVHGLAVNANGDVYVADRPNSRIQKFAPRR